MAGNYIVIGSKFKPFSYAEMIHPIQTATVSHQDLENQYSDVLAKANIWDSIAQNQEDEELYNKYNNYSKDLESQIDILSKEGLTPLSRRNLLEMKGRYSKEIVPIEIAFKRRQELIDEQRKLRAQDNSMLFDVDATNITLGDLIRNPQLSYTPYSGERLTRQVGMMAKNLSKETKDVIRKAILGSQYFETKLQKGFKSEDILKAIQNDDKASPILKQLVEDTLAASNIESWNNENTLNEARKYAAMGLWEGIGEDQYSVQNNKEYDYNNQIRLLRDKARILNKDNKPPISYRRVDRVSVDHTINTKQREQDLKVIEEILKDPSLLNKEEVRMVKTNNRYLPSADPMIGGIIDTGLGESVPEKYKPYIEKLQQMSSRYGTKIDKLTNNLPELAQQLIKDIEKSAIRESVYKPNITDSSLIAKVVKENSRTFNKMTEKTGIYEFNNGKKGKPVDSDDLNKYFTDEVDFDYDPQIGFTMNSSNSKDNKVRHAYIDMSLVDDANSTFAKAHEAINIALKEGENEVANAYIESLMNAFYLRFNTLREKQSNTSSNID